MFNTFNITPRTKEDLRQIWRYSKKTWGKRQADQYVTAIYNRFEWLLDNQILWKYRPEIKEGYYSYQQENHIIFFTQNTNSINIIGIPHQRMDVLKYFYH